MGRGSAGHRRLRAASYGSLPGLRGRRKLSPKAASFNYGGRYLDRLILVDVGPAMTAWPDWSEEETLEAGALFTPQSLYDTAAALRGPDGLATTQGLVASLFSPGYPADKLAAGIEENLKLTRRERGAA
ncbi:hypothetical protein ACMHYB_52470 [Sorangium sp. So ce1128]